MAEQTTGGVQMVNVDGILTLELPYEAMSVEQRMAKGEPTGVVARKYTMSLTQSQLEVGKGFVADVAGDGQQRLVKKVSVTIEDVNPAAVAAKADAKRFRTFVADVKWAAGLVKRKVEPTESERIDRARLAEWMGGKGKVFGREWDALPAETKDKIVDVSAQLLKKSQGTTKAATPTELAKTMAAALEAAGKLDAETKAQLEALLARQAKAKTASKAAKGEDVVTEQGID